MPSYATDKFTNSSLAQSVLTGEFGLTNSACRVPLADFDNLTFTKFNSRGFNPSRTTSFGGHITSVGFLVAGEEMRRAYTGWVVTSMASTLTFWQKAIFQFVGKAMRKHRAVFAGGANSTVPIGILAARPKPTSTSFMHFGPKSLFNRTWCNAVSSARGFVTKFAAILGLVQKVGFNFKSFTAGAANNGILRVHAKAPFRVASLGDS
jgi:hypothetical protein